MLISPRSYPSYPPAHFTATLPPAIRKDSNDMFVSKDNMAVQHGLLLFLLLTVATAVEEYYVRPPPRRIISIPHCLSASHPQQIHVSMVGEHYMRVSYVTTDKSVPSVVEYGRTTGRYEASVMGTSTSYNYYYTSGKIHHVTIGPLEPDAVYYYRCGNVDQEHNFKTPPSRLPIEFAVVGDLGQTDWTNTTLNHMNSSNYDMLLLPGDLSYADGQQPLWDSFGRLVQPFASARPWMVTEGNHEIEGIPILSGLLSFKAFNARWPMPFKESLSTSNLYYSFDAAGGAVHVVMLGSYAEFDEDSHQNRWLETDLRRIDRGRTPWVVVVMHAPWYNTNKAHKGEREGMRRAMERLLYEVRVDVVFAGHVHAYECFKRIYNNVEDPCGPMYVTVGDGGNREGLAFSFDEDDNSAALSAFREASFGHGRLRVLNETHAAWSWHRNDDCMSTIRDQIVIGSLSNSRSCLARGSPAAQVMATTQDEL